LEAALGEAAATLEPIAAQVVAELHAVSAGDQRLVRWGDWVETAGGSGRGCRTMARPALTSWSTAGVVAVRQSGRLKLPG
jgi:hypothetical protein